jgi:Tol biopolymer transport system component
MTLPAGTSLGPYQIVGALGAGGMGEVYRARDPRLGRTVAVKVLPASVSQDAERVRRFEQEARAAGALNHPNILAVFDTGTCDGTPYVVSELLEGETLGTKMAGSPLPLRKSLDYAIQVAHGLAAAHAKGIVHRDLKPDNLFITHDGRVKILDFGLAKLSRPEPHPGLSHEATLSTAPKTTPGAVLGTVGYMAPEQVRGEAADHRSDIFSFGAIFFEMLYGRRAFKADTSAETMFAILKQDPLEAPAGQRVMPPGVERILRHCLEKSPDERFQSARDLAFHLEAISGSSDAVAGALSRPARKWRYAAAAAVALALAAGGASYLLRPPKPREPPRLEYTPLTSFADSAVAPALSPDGRMLAFIRGENTFVGPGEVYVKILPDGEPVQLTHDGRPKTGPTVFSPDGSRVAYTLGTRDTWSVPVLGGEPSLLLTNAAGLAWVDAGRGARRVLFSSWVGAGIHMALFTATESRAEERQIYLPADVNTMVHRSFLSPDRKWVVLVEMDLNGWRPCRLVPFDGISAGREVGPSPAQCTDAGWSPDGQWMYFSANTGGGFHIWRQRLPDGAPEQLTAGATEEQGIAFASDGRSFATSVGESQSTVWVHDSRGERQITSEGFAYLPSFSADGKRLYYLQRSPAGRRFVSGELWVTELESGKRERLLADFMMEHYDVSRDGKRVAFVAVDEAGHSPVWIATLDGSAPPRRLASLDSVRVLFDPAGGILFVGGERGSPFLHRIREDGTGLQRVVPKPVIFIYAVSPDGKALALWLEESVFVYPSDGGEPTLVCSRCATAGEENRGVTPPLLRWSPDGRFLYMHAAKIRRTYAIPLRPGQILPSFPRAGLPSMEAVADLPGAREIPNERAFIGADPSLYAYPRVRTHRNIYRIAVP